MCGCVCLSVLYGDKTAGQISKRFGKEVKNVFHMWTGAGAPLIPKRGNNLLKQKVKDKEQCDQEKVAKCP